MTSTIQRQGSALDVPLREFDPEVAAAIDAELRRQQDTL
jgi:hypothetical protein